MAGLSGNKNGVIQLKTGRSFEDAFQRLESAVASRGLTVFARIKFSDDAQRAGVKMNPTRMLIFGNPRAGTPLMIAAPTLAIDLPLKVLVSQDDDGRVFVTYNSVEYLRDRHNIPDGLLKNISGIEAIAESIA